MFAYCLHYRNTYNDYLADLTNHYYIANMYILNKLIDTFKIEGMNRHLYIIRVYKLTRK